MGAFQRTFLLGNPDANLKGNGRSGGIRTRDPLLPKQMRYQAALRSDKQYSNPQTDAFLAEWKKVCCHFSTFFVLTSTK